MCAVLQRWAPSNRKHCVPIFLVLCRTNELNFTQLIAVTFTTFRPVARISQQGSQKSQGGSMFKTQYWMYAATATKKVACGMVTLFTFTSTQKVVQIWMPKRPSNVICSIAIWAREETRNSIFCKSTKLLSSCKVFSHFTFAPAFSFMSHKLQHISRFAIQQKWANRRYNVAIETQ